MTSLGTIFVVAYAIGFVLNRRVGLLAVAAAAIPFSDSAAVIIGDISISPFHLGIIVYLPLAYLHIGFPRPGSSLPLLLGLWGCVITLVGPAMFSRVPVVASGIGLDQQAGRLSELVYTNSNLAQAIYLLLNLALLLALSSSSDTKRWIPPVPAIVGTAVAMLSWWFHQVGLEWPDAFFHNNTLNAYAYVETARLSAHFSEPSHLGAFALVSAVLLTGTIFVQKPRPVFRIALLAVIAADVLLIVESTSATALVGAAAFATVAALWGLYRVIGGGSRVSIGVLFTILVVVGVGVLILPRMIGLASEIIDYKLARGTSIRSRTAADLTSLQVFIDSGTLGVGLGSNRSSSLLLLMLSTVGLIGTGLFLLIMGRAVRDGLRDPGRRAWAAALMAVLVTSLFSLADLVSPMMWLLAGFCWNASPVANADDGGGSKVKTGPGLPAGASNLSWGTAS